MIPNRVKRVKEEDLELAMIYHNDNPDLDRAELGVLLEREGLGVGHHTHSGCADQIEYINIILDETIPEWKE